MNTVQEQWNSFKKYIPNNIKPTQIIEMRRAFYSGAKALTNINYGIVNGFNVEAASAMLKSIDRELEDFRKDVIEGRA